MALVTYEARRNLAPGHAVGVVYSVPLSLQSAERSVQINRRQQESLSGRVETLFYGERVRWDVEFRPFPGLYLPYMREFLSSTADGQTFEFDPYGTESVPSAHKVYVIRDDDGHSEPRFLALGQGGENDWFEARGVRLRVV